MAEDKPAKSQPKRQVKNPETFRERAIKASQAADKPQRATVKQTGGKLTQPVRSKAGKAWSSKGMRPACTVARPVGKVLLPTYVRNSWQELKLVTWPNWEQSRRLTIAVLIFAIIFGGDRGRRLWPRQIIQDTFY